MTDFLRLAPALYLLLLTSVSANEACADHGHHHEPASAAGGNGFFAPFRHIHFSGNGTPIVHSFGVEPAFTGRDLFTDYRYRSGEGFAEHELELELEWAFTRRLGVILEVPYVFEKEDGESGIDGFDDIAIVPRAIVLERNRFILSSQVEIVAPTGTNGFGGDTAIAPGIAAWLDLGDWWTLNTQLAVEHSFEEDDSELSFGFGLVKSLGNKSKSPDPHGHTSAAGQLHLHLEVTGSAGLDGEEEGDVSAEGLVGLSYGLSPQMDLRVGYEFPLTSPREFDSGVVAGLVWHF